MVDRQDDVEVASGSIAVGKNPMIAMLEQRIKDNLPENGLPGTVEVEGPATANITIQPLKDESTPVTASQSPASNKSPQRGMLRAVSSITITDLEAFEKELSAPPIGTSTADNPKSATTSTRTSMHSETKQSPEKPSATTGPSPTGVEATSPPQTMPRRLSKEMFDALPLAPIRSPSGIGKFRSKSETATSTATSSDPVVKEPPILPLPSIDSVDNHDPDDDLMEFMQPLSDTTGPALVRRKSLDFVPNVPQRTSSATKFAGLEDADSVPNSEEDDAEIELLIKALEAQNGGPLFKPEEGGGPGNKMRQRKSLDLVPLVPRRPSQHDDDDEDDDDDHHLCVKRTSAHSFDRFESTPMMPLHATRPIPTMNGSSKHPVDSDSDADYSPFQAKDVVVSLEDLENKKAALLQPQEHPVGLRPARRKSFDLLPMPPRRFMDENGDDNMPDFDSPRRSSCPEVPRFPSLANRRISTASEGSHSQSDHFLDTESVDLEGEVSNIMDAEGLPMVRAVSAESVPTGMRRRSNIETNADMKAALEVSKDMIRRRSFDILPSVPLRSGSGKARFKKKKNPNFDDDFEPSSTRNESFHIPLPNNNADPFNVEGTVRVLAQRRKSFDFVPNIPSREPYLSDNDLLSDDDFHFNTDDESNMETGTENGSEAMSELVSKPDSVSDHQKAEAKEPMGQIAEGAGSEMDSQPIGMPLTEEENDKEPEDKAVDAAVVSTVEDVPVVDKEETTTSPQGEEALENGAKVDGELASGECLATSESNLVSI